MVAANATLFAFLVVGAVCFVAGVAFAGAIVWLETRTWPRRGRVWIGLDHAGHDDGCVVYGSYDSKGVMHIDRVEFDRDHRA